MSDERDQSGEIASGKSHLPENLFRVVALALLAWIGWTQHNGAVALGTLQSEISKQRASVAEIGVLRNELARLSEYISEADASAALQRDNHAALLGRTLGDAIPIKLPAAVETALVALEAQLVEMEKWPTSATAAQNFRDALATTMRDIPGWAEAEQLGRLNALRWGAAAFAFLNKPEVPDWDVLGRLAQDGSDLLAAAPAGIPQNLIGTVSERSAALAAKMRERLLARVKVVSSQGQPVSEIPDLLVALAELQPDPATREAAEALQSVSDKLEFSEFVKSLSERFALTDALKDGQPVLYEHALATLHSEALSARVAAVGSDEKFPDLEALAARIETALGNFRKKALASESEKQRRVAHAYQQWAISQIQAFDAEMARARRKASERGIIGDKWTQEEYKIVGQAMVEHLLPVGPQWLDLAIHERLQSALGSGWSTLSRSPGHRDYVLAKTVEVAKKAPDTYQ